MTPTQLIDDLKLPHDQIDRIKALKASFEEFEKILHGSHPEHGADTPFRIALLQQAQTCIDLIAQTLGKDRNTILQALLALFGLTETQLDNSCTSGHLVVAVSALLEAKQN